MVIRKFLRRSEAPAPQFPSFFPSRFHSRLQKARVADVFLDLSDRTKVIYESGMNDLAFHPAFARNVEFLRACGVRVLFDPDRYPLPDGTRDPRAIFPCAWGIRLKMKAAKRELPARMDRNFTRRRPSRSAGTSPCG